MSDNMETTALASLASYKGKISRDGPDSKAKSVSSQATSKGGFTGFLNTFLGRDKVTAKSGKAAAGKSQSRLGYNQSVTGGMNDKSSLRTTRTTSSSGTKMDSNQKKALRKSLDKTVAADDASAEASVDSVRDPLSPEVLAAAEEAARMIWDLLYGIEGELVGGTGIYEPGEGFDSLRQLAGLLSGDGRGDGLTALGAGGLDFDALQQAIETANASAEVNAAAVLSALDELLDGMPREALTDALARMAGLDESEDIFNRIAAALDAEVTAVGNGGNPDLLSMLAAGQNPLSPTHATITAAENIGVETAADDIFMLFQQFLSEKVGATGQESPINENKGFDAETGEDVLNPFVAWLLENGKSSSAREQTGNLEQLAQALLRASAGVEAAQGVVPEQGTDVFSTVKGSLENFVSAGIGENAAAESGEHSGIQAQAVQDDIGEATSALFAMGQAAPGTASPAGSAAAAGSASAMMEQIENIERLAETMRMANRGPLKNLTMQLSPPELGKVMLRVESRDGVVSAILRVEKPEAAAQLANNLSQLRANLRAQGIEVGELDIQQRGENEALGDFSGQRRQREAEADYDNRHGSGKRVGVPATGEDDVVESADESPGNANGILNLFA